MRLICEWGRAVPTLNMYANCLGKACLQPSLRKNLCLKSSRASNVGFGSECAGRWFSSLSTVLKSPIIIFIWGRGVWHHFCVSVSQKFSFSFVLFGAYIASRCMSSSSSLEIVSRAAQPGIISLKVRIVHVISRLFSIKATPAELVLSARLLFKIWMFGKTCYLDCPIFLLISVFLGLLIRRFFGRA